MSFAVDDLMKQVEKLSDEDLDQLKDLIENLWCDREDAKRLAFIEKNGIRKGTVVRYRQLSHLRMRQATVQEVKEDGMLHLRDKRGGDYPFVAPYAVEIVPPKEGKKK